MVTMPHWPIILGSRPIELGLERILALLAALGNPHEKLPPVIHVAGTNGKGSTVTFTASILEAAGYRVHRYISPHLVEFNERITLCGHAISDEFLYEVLEECRFTAEKHGITVTFFEGTTAAAFLAFSRVAADALVMETGMGGRLDATNVVAEPAVSIITSVTYDHMEFLGDTIDKIAFEKAGIIKPNTPCVIGPQFAEARAVIDRQAEAVGAPVFGYGTEWLVEKAPNGMRYLQAGEELLLPRPVLHGDHQISNAGLAIAAAKLLALQGFQITNEHIAQGLQSAYWPCRLEHLTQGPLAQMLPIGWELWLDGGHNEGGALILAEWMKQKPDMAFYIIAGITKGRDGSAFFRHFRGLVKEVYGVIVETEPSSYRGSVVAEHAQRAGLTAFAAENTEEAVRAIMAKEQGRACILVCGSLFLVGPILARSQEQGSS